MIEKLTLKGALAFYLITVAALMVIVWMVAVFLFKTQLDAGMSALMAGFVTMFIKMAADASGYQYTSSASSAAKDETQAKVASALADKVSAPTAPPVVAWWSKLTDAERGAIASASGSDTRLQAFITAANAGKASPDDLAYLVSKGLLSTDRAAAIQS